LFGGPRAARRDRHSSAEDSKSSSERQQSCLKQRLVSSGQESVQGNQGDKFAD